MKRIEKILYKIAAFIFIVTITPAFLCVGVLALFEKIMAYVFPPLFEIYEAMIKQYNEFCKNETNG